MQTQFAALRNSLDEKRSFIDEHKILIYLLINGEYRARYVREFCIEIERTYVLYNVHI